MLLSRLPEESTAAVLLRRHAGQTVECTGQRGIAAISHHSGNLHDAEARGFQKLLCFADAHIAQIMAGRKTCLLFKPVVEIGDIVIFKLRQLRHGDGLIIVLADVAYGGG